MIVKKELTDLERKYYEVIGATILETPVKGEIWYTIIFPRDYRMQYKTIPQAINKYSGD